VRLRIAVAREDEEAYRCGHDKRLNVLSCLRSPSGQSSDEFRDALLQWRYRQAVTLGLRPRAAKSSDP